MASTFLRSPPAPHFESWQTPYDMNAYLDTMGRKRRPRYKQLSQGYVFTEELRARLGNEWLSLKPIRTTRHSFPLGFSFRASSQHKAVHGCQPEAPDRAVKTISWKMLCKPRKDEGPRRDLRRSKMERYHTEKVTSRDPAPL